MHLQHYTYENGDKVYTTKKEPPLGLATQSAHPANFSPDDKYSRQWVVLTEEIIWATTNPAATTEVPSD